MSQLSIYNHLIFCRSTSYICFIHRSAKTQAHVSIGNQMKQFNEQKKFQKTLELFDQYRSDSSIELSSQMINQAIKACTKTHDLRRGIAIHHLISSHIKDDVHIVTSLIHFYMQCDKVTIAESLFEQLKAKDTAVYGAMMKGYISQKRFQKAIDLFFEIDKPNEMILVLLFNACAQLKTEKILKLVKQVTSDMPLHFYTNIYVVTSLIDAFIKCGDCQSAERVFDRTKIKDQSSYGAMMKVFVKQGMFQKVIDMYRRIKEPDEVNTLLMFNACAQLRTKEALDLVRDVLSKMPSSFHTHTNLVTSLLDALMNCGDVETAEKLFSQSTTRNISSYNVMMKGYVKQNMFQKAIDLFLQIERPDEVTTLLLFNACAQSQTKQALDLVREISSKMPSSFHSHPYLITSLVDALMKCGDIENAEEIFNQSKIKTISAYNAMLKGYVKQQMFQKAVDLFRQIEKPDEVSTLLLFNAGAQLQTKETLDLVTKVSSKMPSSFYSHAYLISSLIDAFMKHGQVKMAETVFRRQEYGDLSINTSVLAGYVKNNKPFEAIKLFEEIKSKGLVLQHVNQDTEQDVIKSNIMIYLTVLDALVYICDPSVSESIVQQIPTSLRAHSHLYNALIHMWGKIGSIEKAEELFYSMKQPGEIAYNAMINGYGLNGRGKQALDLYHRIPKDCISEITYICILNACSHSGLVDKAYQIFEPIADKTSKIYATMVDCLSRASLFDQAKEMINRFEENSSPSLSMYMALLSGCRNHKNSQLAEEVYNRMIKHFPEAKASITSATILLANTTALSGDTTKSCHVRDQLRRSDMNKSVGLSWSSVNGKFYKFCAHDQSHPRSSEIYFELNRMMEEVARFGYQPDRKWMTRPLKEGETIASALYGHSERLAIAWNFVENPKATRIHVAKNLRICGDCHMVTKLIASIRQCDIVVRDANRIHHFGKNGRCSCNDYF